MKLSFVKLNCIGSLSRKVRGMPDAAKPRVPRRGRPARVEAAAPTGYRASDAVLRELTLSRAFTGLASTQAAIDRAVHDYLSQLRLMNANFRAAAEALDSQMQEAAAQIDKVAPIRGLRSVTTDS
jgi:hypothetical protein